MKQLELTENLKRDIKASVGDDVDLEGIAVFEAITLNTNPLPGKRGTIWEGAKATVLTLRQIADEINGGGHIPLIADHELMGAPKGRVFKAGVDIGDDGEMELRTLFYLDATETALIAKLNAGSLDEVSISFLPTQYQCSECDFDYLSEGANWENFVDRTCDQGHTIGEDGVHVRMIGLATLIEVSLVARGAAKKPKIVGRSTSKLNGAPAQRLAAAGYELDSLVVQASRGESNIMDPKFITELSDAKAAVKLAEAKEETLNLQLTAATEKADGLEAQLTEANEQVTKLTADLEEAKGKSRTEDADAAVTYLTDVLVKLSAANGTELKAEDAPKTVAELTASIDKINGGLTALIPDEPRSEATTTNEDDEKTELKAGYGAFKTNRK